MFFDTYTYIALWSCSFLSFSYENYVDLQTFSEFIPWYFPKFDFDFKFCSSVQARFTRMR